ncbi:hypothetical protein VULLAG_LOCUS12361 [Vulpes lagopus]|uniref:collagen alpha-1(III) chain-like n=1 Tax=Vulpes lagopus TaxID=494514 RepID=UPI001BC8D5F9|nr:collagen alpha-1(III) chain-like [Vulpes lagopus]
MRNRPPDTACKPRTADGPRTVWPEPETGPPRQPPPPSPQARRRGPPAGGPSGSAQHPGRPGLGQGRGHFATPSKQKKANATLPRRQKFASSTQVASGAPGGGFGPPSQLGGRGDPRRAAASRSSVRPRRGGPGREGPERREGAQQPAPRAAGSSLGSRAPRRPRSLLRLLGRPGASSPSCASAAAAASRSSSKSH